MTDPSPDLALELADVWKSFRSPFGLTKVAVLKGVTLRVQRGETVGFLGPNGAGKTTTIKAIMGLVRADTGELRVLGRAPTDRHARHAVGFLPEQPYFYDYLTPREVLELAAALFALPGTVARKRVAEALELLGVGKVRDTPLRKLSKGWLQRVGLAQALVGSPELVVLDEPMSGLDPVGRSEVRELIRRLKQDGVAVLFSSHILSDAELLCDRIAVIVEGQIRFDGPLSRFATDEPSSIDLVIRGLARERLEGVGTAPLSIEEREGKFCVRVRGQREADDLVRRTVEGGGSVLSITPKGLGIEEIFARALKSGASEQP